MILSVLPASLRNWTKIVQARPRGSDFFSLQSICHVRKIFEKLSRKTARNADTTTDSLRRVGYRDFNVALFELHSGHTNHNSLMLNRAGEGNRTLVKLPRFPTEIEERHCFRRIEGHPIICALALHALACQSRLNR
jgi:hypothetical protein